MGVFQIFEIYWIFEWSNYLTFYVLWTQWERKKHSLNYHPSTFVINMWALIHAKTWWLILNLKFLCKFVESKCKTDVTTQTSFSKWMHWKARKWVYLPVYEDPGERRSLSSDQVSTDPRAVGIHQASLNHINLHQAPLT